MKILKLEVDDSVFEKVKGFLEILPKNKLSRYRDRNFMLPKFFIYSILLTYGICQWHKDKRHFFR